MRARIDKSCPYVLKCPDIATGIIPRPPLKDTFTTEGRHSLATRRRAFDGNKMESRPPQAERVLYSATEQVQQIHMAYIYPTKSCSLC